MRLFTLALLLAGCSAAPSAGYMGNHGNAAVYQVRCSEPGPACEAEVTRVCHGRDRTVLGSRSGGSFWVECER